ncbi:MAG: ferrous iron transport protein A [Ignavibacteriaceae bacterium]|nr:ferrous iron transport protein A [Ignavibacteriaceae bacterium]
MIKNIDSSHPSSRRILEIGFTPGQEIELMNVSTFNDPLAFSIRGTLIALRRNEADCIEVE